MAPQTQVNVKSEPSMDAERKIEKLRELFADAPELGKKALANVLQQLKSDATDPPGLPMVSAGRIGSRVGKVSELTIIVPLVPGGAKRLHAFLELLHGNLEGASKVGTVHDMRFVFLDNDTKLLFATAYDGDWDAYIDDFATKIPNALDLLFCDAEGWPGIRSPKVKDWIVDHQVAAEAWYVASPNLTVAETRRLERIGKAVEQLLDTMA